MQATGDCTIPPDETFKQLLLKTLPGIRPYSKQLTRNQQAAEDLMQDTILRALEKHYQWRRGTNLTAWLRTIMRNRYLENCRKKQPLSAGDLATETEGDGFCSILAFHQAEQPIRIELQETGRAIDHLSGEFREVLEMIVLDGSSYEDAADCLKVPVGTIRSRLSRARAALRAHLETERRYPYHPGSQTPAQTAPTRH